MNKILFILPLLIAAFVKLNAQIHHELYAKLDVPAQKIEVVDSITIPIDKLDTTGSIVFGIGSNFRLSSLSDIVRIAYLKKDGNRDYYRVMPVGDLDSVILVPVKYAGVVAEAIKKGSEYNQSFSTTDGIISDQGVYLAGSSNWVPDFNELFTFRLEVELEMTWSCVSQGKRVRDDIVNDRKVIRYDCPFPMEEVYLIAAEFIEYHRQMGGVEVQAFMRKDEEKLVNKYFERTGKDLKLYEGIIGSYPYTKFALVENFWETGYGMPSFTLLGPKVIRFPWIIRTSYPHELLHNWWGNSVYVDYESGNWCEGITAYMADHLFKEQEGHGKEYRRTQLQKFSDFVNTDNDFPLTEFTGRNNAAEQAIGYGKAMMVFHMLRMEYGDEAFKHAFSHFYEQNKFKKASYTDIRKSFDYVTGDSLQWFFDQWTMRKGAPEFRFVVANMKKLENGSEMTLKIIQKQEGDAFRITVPVAFYYDGDSVATVKKLHMTQKVQSFNIFMEKRPYKIELDPEFDIFRKVDPGEVPPSFSRLLGAKKVLLVIPRDDGNFYKYEKLAEGWKIKGNAEGQKVDILQDREVLPYPEYDVIWVFGHKNRFKSLFRNLDELKAQIPRDHQAKMQELEDSGTVLFVIPHPDNQKQMLGYFAATEKSGFSGISDKLPHYSKYSYLGFQGDFLSNKLKGFFPASHSPLRKVVNGALNSKNILVKMPYRKALAY